MNQFRIGFVTGRDSWLGKQKLVAKYFKMKIERIVYPDVYCLPYFLAEKFDLLRDGTYVDPKRYDLIFSELNGSTDQLEYLWSLVIQKKPPVVVIPGPPEILSGVLTNNKLVKVKNILSNADHVWTYSENIRSFCDGLIGFRKTELIPWPFDFSTTMELGQKDSIKKSEKIKVLLNAPLRFHGPTNNYPFILKSILLDIWKDLPLDIKQKITFHSYVYNKGDKTYFQLSEFSKGLPIKLEKKRSYRSFVGFIASCDAVINLTVGTIFGRITFLAAAFEKPGLFSDNAELNRCLYPGANIPILDTEKLRRALQSLMSGLVSHNIEKNFLPSKSATEKVGDFTGNSTILKQLLEKSQQ